MSIRTALYLVLILIVSTTNAFPQNTNDPTQRWECQTPGAAALLYQCRLPYDAAKQEGKILARELQEQANPKPTPKDDDGKLSMEWKEAIVRVLKNNGYGFAKSSNDLACYQYPLLTYCHSRSEPEPFTLITLAMNPSRIGIGKPLSPDWKDCFVASSVGFTRIEPSKCGPFATQ